MEGTLNSCRSDSYENLILPATDLATEALIPKPLEIHATKDAFRLDQYTGIYTSSKDESFETVARFLQDKINSHTQLRVKANDHEGEIRRAIYLRQGSPDTESNESYELHISRDSVIINAHAAEGAFRGVQTLRQLIPHYSNNAMGDCEIWPIPTGNIIDTPGFEYRGSMLDVARHFFSVVDVKKYIDLLSYYKINALHLHLTDDQGWRIEIKSWPRLTEVGGSTSVRGESPGFFTQEDYKEIVDYAADHFMTVVPEIDMPGHTNAASVSYPFLNGNAETLELYEGTETGFSTFDTRKESVYAFIDDVVREISELTPGPYIHVGGDESHVTDEGDYIYFVNKVEKIVRKYGKRMIGWDEVATADLDSTSIAQFWNDEENARRAVEKGMKVILSPSEKMYLDMQYDSLSKFGSHWAGYIPVDTAYAWTPETYAEGLHMDHVLGMEAPLWSETITDISELEYLAFPRMIGYSELSWTPEERRDWEDYKSRLARQAPFLDTMNVRYYQSEKIDWEASKPIKTSQETN